jgi:hypothetical protein
MTVLELRKEAELLPEAERGELVAELLETFGRPAYDVSDEEVARRVEESESGKVPDVTFDELKAGIQAHFQM